YAQGLRVVLLIDEAQALPVDTLEQVRLLTNLETDTQKLLQVILIGQPELRDMLAEPGLRQLAQRITARFHLTPLDAPGTAEYLRHRFRMAGGQHFPFDAGAVQRIHLRSGGIPRLVIVLAERALLAGYAGDRATIDAALVEEAAREALPPAVTSGARRTGRLLAVAGVGAVAVMAIAVAALWPREADRDAIASPGIGSAAPSDPATGAASLASISTVQAPASAVAVAVAVDTADLATRIADEADDAARNAAWQALLAAWTLPHTAEDARAASGCAPALAAGTYCVRGSAHLDRLVAIGRPALLQLDAANASAWALLQGSDGRHARLLLGDAVIDVDRATLQQAWSGRYSAVWRSSAGLLPAPARGAAGASVDWLRERLVREGVAAAAAPGTGFDDALVDSVRRFQRARGLAVDGVVGPETLFALASGDAGPRLLRRLD